MKRKNIGNLSIVGLGKLGLPLASIFAKNGYHTIGIDINNKGNEYINKGITPVVENGLEKLISEVGGKSLVCSNNYDIAISDTNVTYILTATPSKSDGSFSNEQIESALESLSLVLKKSTKKNHLFVISSTVMPGSIQNTFIPLIEKISGRVLNKGFQIAYCPDFVAIGEVIKGFLNPEFVVIGQSCKEAGDIVSDIHHNITENNPPLKTMSLASAEIAKVSLNAYITMKISFANNLANICEQVPNSDVDDITSAIGLDKRISPFFFKAGMSYGGTCFPRDTFAFNNLSNNVGLSTNLFDAVSDINDYQDNHLADLVLKELSKSQNKRIIILGMAFKAATPVIDESVGVKLVKNLLQSDNGIDIVITDPLGLKNSESLFTDKVTYTSSIHDSMKNCDVAVLINNEKEFIESIYKLDKKNKITIIDCWRLLKNNPIQGKLNIINWGIHRGVKE
jgi:UDPglucose 6-dehydrogenase